MKLIDIGNNWKNITGHLTDGSCCSLTCDMFWYIRLISVFFFYLMHQKTLGEKIQDTMVGHSGSGPRDLLSPESGNLVRQLEVRIKELKGWLRDTELFIFNSCLRQENEGTMTAEKQLQYFKVIKKNHSFDSEISLNSQIKYISGNDNTIYVYM